MNHVIFVLVIDNDAGLQISLHHSYGLALQGLADYCRANWDKETPAPTDNAKCVEEYFHATQEDRAEIAERRLPV